MFSSSFSIFKKQVALFLRQSKTTRRNQVLTTKRQMSFARRSLSNISNEFKRTNPSLVVFDKDGTLIDFNLMWGGWVEQQAWMVEMTTKLPVREKLFDAMGYDWIRRSIRSKGALCCTPMSELYKIAVKILITEGMVVEQAEATIQKCWSMPDPVVTSRPLGDIPAIFRTIKQMDMKIAVCTTDDRQPTIDTLKHLNVLDKVDMLMCGDDGIPAKPAPEQLWTICHNLGVEPHNTIMVGDTSTDMVLGKNAGCGLNIGVLGGASSLDDLAIDADVLVPTLDKVVKILFQYGQQAIRHGVREI
jgi:phosphoglycolate phosphatase-like HAD superfamily hydrolase